MFKVTAATASALRWTEGLAGSGLQRLKKKISLTTHPFDSFFLLLHNNYSYTHLVYEKFRI